LSEYDSGVLANGGAGMRGSDKRSGDLFSYVDLEDRVPAKHPLRMIRRIVNDVLVALDAEFAKIYATSGRPSIPPERLLRALLLQAFYTIRSETQLMEQLNFASTTDPEAKLYRKGKGKEAKLSYIGNAMTENCHGLVVETELGAASGTIEREAAQTMIVRHSPGSRRITVGADKGVRYA
jgi:hypothetical protein